MEPNCGFARGGNRFLRERGWTRRKRAEDFGLETAIEEHGAQFARGKVSSAEWAGLKAFPRLVDRAEQQNTIRMQDAAAFREKFPWTSKIIDGFEKDDGVEGSVPEGEGVSVQPDQREAPAIVRLRFPQERFRKVSPDDAASIPRQITQPHPCGASDFEHVFAFTEAGRKAVACIKHRCAF